VAHFEAEEVVITGEGVFPAVQLNLPRVFDMLDVYEGFLDLARANVAARGPRKDAPAPNLSRTGTGTARKARPQSGRTEPGFRDGERRASIAFGAFGGETTKPVDDDATSVASAAPTVAHSVAPTVTPTMGTRKTFKVCQAPGYIPSATT
jgi:hypothetical protein